MKSTLMHDVLSPPIFILGIRPRVGTNFLKSILEIHPDCAPFPIPEDNLLAGSRHLMTYVDNISTRYPTLWNVDKEKFSKALLQSLGGGIEKFIQAQNPGKRVVLKTPWVDGLGNFERLFPSAQAIVLIRDGRASTESYVQTMRKLPLKKNAQWFNCPDHWYELSFKKWAAAAKTVLKVFNSDVNPSKLLLIKYEDLVKKTESEVRKILEFLNLPIAKFNYSKISQIPLIGSCIVSDPINLWIQPPLKPKDFDPLNRFKNWDGKLHRQFNIIAGKEAEQLGYKLKGKIKHSNLKELET